MTLNERLISEAIRPAPDSMDTARMASGQPGLPHVFLWRGKTVRIRKILRQWRETGPCRHGSGEKYLRKYWYEVETGTEGVMKIYFLKPGKGNSKDAGWRLFSVKTQH